MIVGEHNRENDLTVNITKTSNKRTFTTKDQTQTMNRPRIDY